MRVLKPGRGDADTSTPRRSVVFPVRTARAQLGREIARELITDSASTRRAVGQDLGGRRPIFTDSQIRNTLRLTEARG